MLSHGEVETLRVVPLPPIVSRPGEKHLEESERQYDTIDQSRRVPAHKRERVGIGRGCNCSYAWKDTFNVCPLHAGRQLNGNREFDHSSPHHHLRRPNTKMDFRKSFSKPFKKLKHRLAEGSSRKRDVRSGSENDREGGEVGVEGSEASQRNSRLHSEVGDMVESGPRREGDDVEGKKVGRVDPPTSTPSISVSHSGKPNSA
jgi:hypothetical protein